MTEASPDKLPGPFLRQLKAKAQQMQPDLMVGKQGLSPDFLRCVGAALEDRELVKVKFTAFKEQKKELVKQLVEDQGAHLVMRVGNVAVLYRENPDPARRRIQRPG